MKDILLNYATQPSTWRGLAIVGGACGLVLSPDAWQAIGSAVAATVGAVEIVRNETKKV
ncbi:MAG: hypothetical protein HGA47_06855 [Zoogloea sp.]|nr:hypothetical protein [Zoogloea sp.]